MMSDEERVKKAYQEGTKDAIRAYLVATGEYQRAFEEGWNQAVRDLKRLIKGFPQWPSEEQILQASILVSNTSAKETE